MVCVFFITVGIYGLTDPRSLDDRKIPAALLVIGVIGLIAEVLFAVV